MALLSLFPLPNVVLFPGVLLPLHIFEARYRALVADTLDDDRRIGMVLLKPGWETEYEGRPPIYPVGCSGVIVHAVRLDDGRYNIVLRGLERFRLVGEDHARAYRRATIEYAPEPSLDGVARAALSHLRSALEAQLGLAKPGMEDAGSTNAAHFAALNDADFVNSLAQYLDLEPIERQALLECHSVRHRAEALVDLLDMKRVNAATPGVFKVAH